MSLKKVLLLESSEPLERYWLTLFAGKMQVITVKRMSEVVREVSHRNDFVAIALSNCQMPDRTISGRQLGRWLLEEQITIPIFAANTHYQIRRAIDELGTDNVRVSAEAALLPLEVMNTLRIQ